MARLSRRFRACCGRRTATATSDHLRLKLLQGLLQGWCGGADGGRHLLLLLLLLLPKDWLCVKTACLPEHAATCVARGKGCDRAGHSLT
jgi:hypothetical protein